MRGNAVHGTQGGSVSLVSVFRAYVSVQRQCAFPPFLSLFLFHRSKRDAIQEATNRQVDVADVDALSMRHILEYMYTGAYALPGGIAIPKGEWYFCSHGSLALCSRGSSVRGSRIFKRACPCAGKVLAPGHLLLHVRIYTVADYFDMFGLKEYARQGVLDVLHVYWQDQRLRLADVLDETFTATPDGDVGVRDVLIEVLKEHPGLVVDGGEVRRWLDENPTVNGRVHWD